MSSIVESKRVESKSSDWSLVLDRYAIDKKVVGVPIELNEAIAQLEICAPKKLSDAEISEVAKAAIDTAQFINLGMSEGENKKYFALVEKLNDNKISFTCGSIVQQIPKLSFSFCA